MDIGGQLSDYPQKETAHMIRQKSLTENLKNRKTDLEVRLTEVNKAIEALEKNPELQNLFDLISKVRY